MANRYSPAPAAAVAVTRTSATSIGFMRASPSLPVRAILCQRLQERADLRDLIVVQDFLPRRHLLVCPAVLDDGDELPVPAPEGSKVRGVLAEARDAVGI